MGGQGVLLPFWVIRCSSRVTSHLQTTSSANVITTTIVTCTLVLTRASLSDQIYATSEERKQRNRQAQAAFRERRTEYIKQLEETIRVHESNLHNLQAAHRTAAEECLMLRYKNSLLERILLEKGTLPSIFKSQLRLPWPLN